MIAQWENECISLSALPVVQVQFPDHTLPTCPGPACQKEAQTPLNGTTQPVDIEEELAKVQPWTENG